MSDRQIASSSELPKGWAIAHLHQVAEVILGQSPPSSTYNSERKGLPFYQGKFDFGPLYPRPRIWCTKPKKTVEKDDILVSVRAPVGPTNICQERSAIGRGLAALRPRMGINVFYLLYYLRSIEKSWRGTGSTFDAINGDVLKTQTIPIPPTAEQKRIVSKIEELFAKLDAGVKALKKAREQLKQYRQSVLNYAFHGILTETWRQKNSARTEPALKFLEQRNALLVSSRRKLYDDRSSGVMPYSIPQLWSWTKIGSVFDVKPGGTPSRKMKEYWNGNIPWVSSGEVANCILTSTAELITNLGVTKSNAKVHPPETVLLAMIGEGKTRGQTAILKISAATNQNVAAILCAESGMLSQYIFYWLMERYLETRRRGSGGMQQALNAGLVMSIPIPIAPIEEQRVLVELLERYLSMIDVNDKIIDQSIMRSAMLRKGILTKAFAGNLMPQDPKDEPATILLERISEARLMELKPRGETVDDKGMRLA